MFLSYCSVVHNAFMLIAIIITLYVVWAINENPQNAKVVWGLIPFLALTSYLTIYAQSKDSHNYFIYTMFTISMILFITIPSVGGIYMGNGTVSWEVLTASLLGVLYAICVVCLITNNYTCTD